MVGIEQLAEVALAGDALRLRELVQDWLRENPRLSQCMPPASRDLDVWAIAAGLVELFAERSAQAAPDWTADVGPVRQPVFLVRAAATMPRLRELCQTQSPPPLRRRGLYAPPDYLSFA